MFSSINLVVHPFQKEWHSSFVLSQTIISLTKFIERNINIYIIE